MIYDLAIIGGGPAGIAAGVYAARKKLSTIVLADTFGGQSIVSADIQNWIGTKSIPGIELAGVLEEHLRSQEGIQIKDGVRVSSIEELPNGNLLLSVGGETIETKTALIATGSVRRKLGVKGEHELDGRGVAYCSICDAPLFGGKPVAVVGGGNSALEAVLDLIPYASDITLIHRGAELKGDQVTQDRILSNPKVSVLFNMEISEIIGSSNVESIHVRNTTDGLTKSVAVSGVFIEIGFIPASDLVKDIVTLDARGAIVTDPKTQKTSHVRIWAAGDVTDGLYQQNNISVGDAVKAVLNIYESIHLRRLLG